MMYISIIIPAYNEENSIGKLLESISNIRYPADCFEVLVVNDGSTDRTAEVVANWPGVRLLNLPENVGRYECRRRGAEAALYPNLLFVDAHSKVDPDILSVLGGLGAKVVNGRLEEIENPGLFETFYRSIRRLIYPQFYKQNNGPFYLTVDNFDSMPKGMTIFYVDKEVLFSAYKDLSSSKINKDTSDDTKLLRAIVAREAILNHPSVKITYFSRTSFRASVKHLFERGPRFVDYYLNPAQRNFWLVIVFPLLALFLGLLLLFFLQVSPLAKIATLVGLDLLLVFVLARSLREIAVIFIMLPVCALVFYSGILKGIFGKLFNKS